MADDSLKEFLTDQLAALPGLRARRMFGGFGLYHDKRFFGMLIQGRLYFKTNEQTRPSYAERGMSPFVYEKGRRFESVTYFEVPPDVLEDREQLVAWAQRAVAAAAATPRKKLRK